MLHSSSNGVTEAGTRAFSLRSPNSLLFCKSDESGRRFERDAHPNFLLECHNHATKLSRPVNTSARRDCASCGVEAWSSHELVYYRGLRMGACWSWLSAPCASEDPSLSNKWLAFTSCQSHAFTVLRLIDGARASAVKSQYFVMDTKCR